MKIALLGLVAVLPFAGSAVAQRLAAYDALGSTFTELQPPTALLPTPNPPIATYPTIPLLPPPPVSAPQLGDSTYDNRLGMHWFTDGTTTLAAMPIPAYPPLGPVPPPIPFPPGFLGLTQGPITGLAYDPVGNVMYFTGVGGLVVGVTPIPGLPVVVPPFPIQWMMGNAVAGLEWDGATGSLWAVDTGFFLYNFLPGGAALNIPTLPIGPLPPGPPEDIAIDKVGTANPAGFRPLYVVGGGLVVDARDPMGLPFPAGPIAAGLAFLDHPADIPLFAGCEGCPGITAGPTAFTTSVMSSGNVGFSVGMGGLKPLVDFGVFAFDTTTAPIPFPLINGPGTCPLGLVLSPTLILVIGGPADAAGNIYLPINLGPIPVGTYLHNQNFTFCPNVATWLAFSRFQTITVGGM